MADHNITNGGIRVELGSSPRSNPSNNGKARSFPLPNDDHNKIRPLDDLALSDLTLDQFPVVKEWRRRLFDPEWIPEICDELPRLLTEYMRCPEAHELSPQTRRANALHHVFSNKTPIVRKTDLLPGQATTSFVGPVVYADTIGYCIWPELKTVSTRPQNPFKIRPEVPKRLNREIFPYWLERRTVQEVARYSDYDTDDFKDEGRNRVDGGTSIDPPLKKKAVGRGVKTVAASLVCSWCGMFLVMISLVAGGCASHIHNPDDQALAEKAVEQAEALRKAQSDVSDAMLSNLATIEKQRDAAYRELGNGLTAARSSIVASMTWLEFRQELGGGDANKSPVIDRNESWLRSLLSEINRDLLDAKADVTKAGEVINEAEKQLKEAKNQLSGWNRRVAVWEKLVKLMPDVTSAMDEVDGWDAFKSAIKDLAENFKDEQVTYQDADGDEKKESLPNAIKVVIDDSHRKGDRETGKIIDGIKAVFSVDAPGLVLVVAGLGKDLAELERDHARTRVNSLTTRLQIAKQAQAYFKTSKEFIKEAYALVSDKSNYPDDETATRTLRRLSRQPDPVAKVKKITAALDSRQADNALHLIDDLREWLKSQGEEAADEKTKKELEGHIKDLDKIEELAKNKNMRQAAHASYLLTDRLSSPQELMADAIESVQKYVIASGPLYARIVGAFREDARLQHLNSIQVSRHAVAQHDTLVARGINALTIYHSGGIKTEEVAEIAYRIAELTILGVIAQRID